MEAGGLARTNFTGMVDTKEMTKELPMESIRTSEENPGHIDGYADRARSWAGPGSARRSSGGCSAPCCPGLRRIHLYLVLTGFGGVLGVLFVLNAIGGVVLAIAMIAAPPRFVPLASVRPAVHRRHVASALRQPNVGLFGIFEQPAIQSWFPPRSSSSRSARSARQVTPASVPNAAPG